MYLYRQLDSPNRHRISIQTHTDAIDDKEGSADLEYGVSRKQRGDGHSDDRDVYQMRGPKVL